MLFNSIEFAVFLPIVFLLYWFASMGRTRVQNAILLIASYVFYGWWEWRFLSLIVFSSGIDYSVGILLEKTEDGRRRKALLCASIIANLGLLGFFKYYDFFLANLASSFTLLGFPIADASQPNMVIPVGISFYTFQTMSYSIDVYRRKLKPTTNIISFFAFVSFFPQLVAGPIERATNLLGQFHRKRVFSYQHAVDGMRQILWGLFKKVVIADSCAHWVNLIFKDRAEYGGSTLLLGAILFAFQIYGDFSGYSDMAIGVSRLFGFRLMRNFAFPYLSRDIAEFWRRWHISLSTWFRDYVYIPLGGSRGSLGLKVRNTLVIFLVSGFWHGAQWKFILWGCLHALYFLPLLIWNRNRRNTDTVGSGRLLPSVAELAQIVATFFLTTVAWVFFRASSIRESLLYLAGIFSQSLFSTPQLLPMTTLLMIAVLLAVEWIQREKEHGLQLDNTRLPLPVRWGAYCCVVLSILECGGTQQEFIYFQF